MEVGTWNENVGICCPYFTLYTHDISNCRRTIPVQRLHYIYYNGSCG